MSHKILITGAGGFVGRNLDEFLANKYDIIAAKRTDLDLLDENKVESIIKKEKINFIIHCASVGGSRKTGYDAGKFDVIGTNLRMFHNLARCLTSDMRMIHFGSGAEYDMRNYQPKMPESFFDTHVPADDYGYSKYLISKYIEKTDNITCLRIFGLYGRHEDYKFKFISNAIVKNLLDLPIKINQNVLFDYLYIDDLLNIFEKIINKQPKASLINLTPDESIDLYSIAEIINSTGSHKSEIILCNEGLNREYSGSNRLLLSEIDCYNFSSYCNGIKKLYNYYEFVIDKIDVNIIKQDPYLSMCKTLKN